MKRIRSSLFVLLLALGAFLVGFSTTAATPQTSCVRLEAECTYDVRGSQCFDAVCNSGGYCYGSRCCYFEYGWCRDDPSKQDSSQICGGLCGMSDWE